jgi:gas vesicle protein
MSDQDNKGNPLFLGVILGIVAGVASAMLYTPKKGSEVRDELKSKLNEVPSEVDKLLKDIRELYHKSVELVIGASKEQCNKLSDALGDAENAVKAKLKDKTTKGKN